MWFRINALTNLEVTASQEDECSQLMKEFFAGLRRKRKRSEGDRQLNVAVSKTVGHFRVPGSNPSLSAMVVNRVKGRGYNNS